MNETTLSALHATFNDAFTKGIYLNTVSDARIPITTSLDKKVSLQQIFQEATRCIQQYPLTEQGLKTLQDDKSNLQKLHEIGNRLYQERYCNYKKIKVFLRKLLIILHIHFPKLFPKDWSRIEKDTEEAFLCYSRLVNEKLLEIKQQTQFIQQQQELYQVWKQAFAKIQDNLTSLCSPHLSLRTFKRLLGKCLEEIKCLPDVSLDVNIERQSLHLFMTQSKALAQALEENNDKNIQTLLQNTPLGNNFLRSQTQPLFELQCRKVNGNMLIHKEQELKNFQGVIRISSYSAEIKYLNDYLQSYSSCQPCSLEINFKSEPLIDFKVIQSLLELSDRVPDIYLDNLEKIDLQNAILPLEEERQFLKLLLKGDCPQLKELVLTNQPNKQLTSNQCTALLTLSPTQQLLRQCCQLCLKPEEIPQLPSSLIIQPDINLERCSISQVKSLIPQFSAIRTLNLNETSITDHDISEWINKGLFQNLQTLYVEKCPNLTTDAVVDLIQVGNLWKLYLDKDLRLGERSFEKLPQLNNPFKIYHFCLQPAILREMAYKMYTGPCNWAVLFQIPLAMQGIGEIFPQRHKVLDPDSVVCWLYQDSFKYLREPQTAVETILVDNCQLINDQNLVPFIQKFPNLIHLSLRNCLHITNQGIFDLIDYLGQKEVKLRSIDLTSCPLTGDIFLSEIGIKNLCKLEKIILSDTQISFDSLKETLNYMQTEVDRALIEQLEKSIILEERTLCITDEELAKTSLEAILASKQLNRLIRISLEGCTQLTNADLAHLLNCLGLPLNHLSRLNIKALNLTGCHQITPEVFKVGENEEGNWFVRPLGTLNQIAIKDTAIAINPKVLQKLQAHYSSITFQEEYQNLTDSVDLECQLQLCQTYYQEKNRHQTHANLTPLLSTLIKNRIVLQLFGHTSEDQDVINCIDDINQVPIDPLSDEYKDTVIQFDDDKGTIVSIPVHGHIIYRSPGFKALLEQGWHPSIPIQNQLLTAKASQYIIDLIYDSQDDIYTMNLDELTAYNLAQLTQKEYFDFPLHYLRLLDHARKQFTLDKADKMCEAAFKCQDWDGLRIYKENLERFLEHAPNLASSIKVIAHNFGFEELKQRTVIEMALQSNIEPFDI